MNRILIAIVLISFGLYGDEMKPLKPLGKYKSTEFNLKDGVDYLEIRMYSGDDKRIHTNKYSTQIVAFSKHLATLDTNLVRQFKSIEPNLNGADIRKSTMCLMMGCVSRVGNGFAIENGIKAVRMNETKDIVEYLGTIDTPAELKLVLWLNDNLRDMDDTQSRDLYIQTKNGYKVHHTYENMLANQGECGVFTQEIMVNQKGVVTSQKPLKTLETKECIYAD